MPSARAVEREEREVMSKTNAIILRYFSVLLIGISTPRFLRKYPFKWKSSLIWCIVYYRIVSLARGLKLGRNGAQPGTQRGQAAVGGRKIKVT